MAEFLKDYVFLTKEHFTTLYMPQEQRENYGTVKGETALQNKVVALFFSAAWCPPCQHFVPMLREMYEELKNRDSEFEIVFVSMDRNKEEMMEYYKEKHGNWLALKFDDPKKDTLTEKYKVSIIPKLIVIRPDGELITSKGRKDVQDKGLISFRGWHSAMLAAAKKADQQQQLLDSMEAENEGEESKEAED